MAAPKYVRDNLVSILAERATFERSAVMLYDALLGVVEDVEHPLLVSSMGDMRRHRDEEEQHAIWTEGLLEKLGGRPDRGLSDAATREARAELQIIERASRSGALMPTFHAMLASELMDVDGWVLLLRIANEVDDRPAIKELEEVIARENEHLALVRELIFVLSRESVSFEAATGNGARRGRTEQRRREIVAAARAARAQRGRGRGGYGSEARGRHA
ncbi:MAG: hypothetical protein JWP87_2487 [Labilithrix sp.]|nr:hypothetical protein [Labilithrix sp.]